jgi:hypothetical protein
LIGKFAPPLFHGITEGLRVTSATFTFAGAMGNRHAIAGKLAGLVEDNLARSEYLNISSYACSRKYVH